MLDTLWLIALLCIVASPVCFLFWLASMTQTPTPEQQEREDSQQVFGYNDGVYGERDL